MRDVYKRQLYTYILLVLLVFVGVYFTIRTKGVQIRFIKDMFTQLTEKKHVKGERSISSFQALMVLSLIHIFYRRRTRRSSSTSATRPFDRGRRVSSRRSSAAATRSRSCPRARASRCATRCPAW